MKFIFIALIAIVITGIIYIFLRNKKQQKQQEQYQAELKERDANLVKQLSNPYNNEEADKIYHPYEINYFDVEKNKPGKGKNMFRIIEKRQRMERRYLFEQSETVYIGIQDKELIVCKTPIEKVYCKIRYNQEVYYIRAAGEEKIIVKRKRKQRVLDEQGICLETGDIIQILDTEFLFEILK